MTRHLLGLSSNLLPPFAQLLRLAGPIQNAGPPETRPIELDGGACMRLLGKAPGSAGGILAAGPSPGQQGGATGMCLIGLP